MTPTPNSHGAARAGRSPAQIATFAVVAVAVIAGAAWLGWASRGDAAAPATPAAASAAAAAPGMALPAAAQTALDAGNAAFRAAKYDSALSHYRAAAQAAPQHSAAWYGIPMVAQKTGNSALADSAAAELRVRGGAAAGFHGGATPAGGDTTKPVSPHGTPAPRGG